MVSNEIQSNALYDDTAARRHDEVSRERGRMAHVPLRDVRVCRAEALGEHRGAWRTVRRRRVAGRG